MDFDLVFSPGEQTSVLNDAIGATNGNYWDVEIFGSQVDITGQNLPTERKAVTIVNIPSSEELKGVQRPGKRDFIVHSKQCYLTFWHFKFHHLVTPSTYSYYLYNDKNEIRFTKLQ